METREGNTPLHIAAGTKDTTKLSCLLAEQQCDPNAQNKKGDTPLHIAARENNTAALSQLLDHKQCDPNAQSKEGDTPLHIAARENNTAALSQLLDHKQCDPNAQNKEGDTPLHIAVRIWYVKHKEIITNPLSCAKCNLDASLNIPKYILVIALLLEKKCGISIPNKKGETAQEIPLNEYGDHLLHLACQLGNVSISKYIITHLRSNPNAVQLHENIDIVVHLLTAYEECDPNILNREGDTPLHIAVRKNNTAALSQLLDHEHCDPNVRNKKGNHHYTLLLWKNRKQPYQNY